MQEIVSEEDEREAEQEANKSMAQTEHISQPRSRESLWGAFLFAFMFLFVIVSIASIGWGVYTGWKSNRLAKAEPSIAVLSQQSNEQKNIVVTDEAKASENGQSKQSEEQTLPSDPAGAKKMLISVLNGGAAKGSAGIAATFLKGEGYVNVTPGNTLKDYLGTVVYYAASLEKEAEAIKTTLVKKYPQAKILPADAKNKETSVSQITIILGK